jgi:L-amino acid N-acyltransferase YncA
MIPEYILDDYPKEAQLKEGLTCQLRPLQCDDETRYFLFFQSIPERERLFIKHRVDDQRVIREWCRRIDLGRNFPLLALSESRIIGVATLHQELGGWKRDIGRVSVFVRPYYRGRGLARTLIAEIVDLARNLALSKVEAEFIGEQEREIHIFAFMGFTHLLRLPNYVKDLEGRWHDYILMGQDLVTDEEYAGAG